jgi:hypothetical protein
MFIIKTFLFEKLLLYTLFHFFDKYSPQLIFHLTNIHSTNRLSYYLVHLFSIFSLFFLCSSDRPFLFKVAVVEVYLI